MNEPRYTEQAKALCDAIRRFAENEDAIENFESYLEWHFPVWFDKYVKPSPDDLISEFEQFSRIG